MTLSFFLPLSGTQPCRWEKEDPQLTTNAEEGRGDPPLSPASLGGKGNCWVLCLWFLWQIGASRDRKLKNLASLPSLPAVPHAKGCWWGELLRLLLPRSPQIKRGAHREQPSQTGQTPQRSALPWVVLYSTGIHSFLPLLSNSEDQRTLSSTFENISNTYILVKDAIYRDVRLLIISDLYVGTLPSPLEVLQSLLPVSRCCAFGTIVLQKRCWVLCVKHTYIDTLLKNL